MTEAFDQASSWKRKAMQLAAIFLLALVVGSFVAPSIVEAQTTGPSYLWARQYDSGGNSVAVDRADNAYVAGNRTISTGNSDVIINKYGPDGIKLWTRQLGTNKIDSTQGIATDSAGNAYVAGYTEESLDGNTSAGGRDAFLTKYAADGTKLWTKQFGSNPYGSGDYAFDVAVDSTGNAYVTGYTDGTFAGNVRGGFLDGYVAKFSPDGNMLWIRQFGSKLHEYIYDIAVDSAGNSYASGSVERSPDSTATAGSSDALVVKYDPDGNQLWSRQFGSSERDQAEDIAVDSGGNAYVGGYTYGALGGNTSAGGEDGFVARYNPDGTQAWIRQFGTSSSDRAYGVAVSSEGAPFVSGTTFGVLGDSTAGVNDAFVRKYRSDGTPEVTRQFGTSDQDEATGVAVGPGGNPYVAGKAGVMLEGADLLGTVDGQGFLTKFAPNLDLPPEPAPALPNPDLGDDLGLQEKGNLSDIRDPINVTTGNVYEIKEDLNIPAKGLPLQFIRIYNSQDPIRQPLGYGWTHSYNTSLKQTPTAR